MRTLASLLQTPEKAASDAALLNHLYRLRAAVKELQEAAGVIEEELGTRRAIRLKEHIRRDVIGV